jgi:SsrA-binding protein
MTGTKEKQEHGSVAVNRQAYHDSIRDGRVNLRGAFARVSKNEIWVEGMHVAPYAQGTYMNHEPLRSRKLLLHRRQIANLIEKIQAKGMTIVPLRLYFKGDHAKLEIGVCRGKKLYDKRDDAAKRDADREMARAVRRG